MDNCIICGKEVKNYDPEYCCTGEECGCLGKPIEPPICSDECWTKLIRKT